MKLVYHPNKVLETRCDEIDLENLQFNPKELKEEAVDFMRSHNGIGMSCNQVGITDARWFVMQTMDKTQSILCMNPTILQHTAETNVVEEGCMSFPNLWMKIKRPREILVHFFDEDCVEQVFKMDDVNSRIYQHELDHTLGITFKDRVTNAKWDLASRKANKINKRLADA